MFLIYGFLTFLAAVMLANSGAWLEAAGLCVACLVAWFSAIQVAQTLAWVRMPNKIKILLVQTVLLGCSLWGASLIDYTYIRGGVTVTPLAWVGLGTVVGLWNGFKNKPGGDEIHEANQPDLGGERASDDKPVQEAKRSVQEAKLPAPEAEPYDWLNHPGEDIMKDEIDAEMRERERRADDWLIRRILRGGTARR